MYTHVLVHVIYSVVSGQNSYTVHYIQCYLGCLANLIINRLVICRFDKRTDSSFLYPVRLTYDINLDMHCSYLLNEIHFKQNRCLTCLWHC